MQSAKATSSFFHHSVESMRHSSGPCWAGRSTDIRIECSAIHTLRNHRRYQNSWRTWTYRDAFRRSGVTVRSRCNGRIHANCRTFKFYANVRLPPCPGQAAVTLWLPVIGHRQVTSPKTWPKIVSASSWQVKGYDSTKPTELWTDWKFTLKLKICSAAARPYYTISRWQVTRKQCATQWIMPVFQDIVSCYPLNSYVTGSCMIKWDDDQIMKVINQQPKNSLVLFTTWKPHEKPWKRKHSSHVSQPFFPRGRDQKFIVFDLQLEEESDFLHAVAIMIKAFTASGLL